MRALRILALSAGILNLVSVASWSHPGHEQLPVTHGWLQGLLHPFLGADHILAAVAVGLLAAMTRERGLMRVPGLFLMGMMLGILSGVLAAQGAPAVTGIAISVVALGLLVWKGSGLGASLLVPGILACGFYHGFAHMADRVASDSALLYATGLLMSTLGLHGMGIAAGLSAGHWTFGPKTLRWAGAAIALTGLVLLLS
jgi:urease accessory protein